MNRFQAIDKLLEVNQLLEKQKYGSAMKALGMNDELFPEGQPLEELFQAMTVRIENLKKIAGMK